MTTDLLGANSHLFGHTVASNVVSSTAVARWAVPARARARLNGEADFLRLPSPGGRADGPARIASRTEPSGISRIAARTGRAGTYSGSDRTGRHV
jgi:hypothetical protein